MLQKRQDARMQEQRKTSVSVPVPILLTFRRARAVQEKRGTKRETIRGAETVYLPKKETTTIDGVEKKRESLMPGVAPTPSIPQPPKQTSGTGCVGASTPDGGGLWVWRCTERRLPPAARCRGGVGAATTPNRRHPTASAQPPPPHQGARRHTRQPTAHPAQTGAPSDHPPTPKASRPTHRGVRHHRE